MRRLLWNGDACVATGFARVTHAIIPALRPTWDCHVLGINFFGDTPAAHRDLPGCEVYVASLGGDSWGLERIPEMLQSLRPDYLVLQNDPWNVAQYVRPFAKSVPIVAYMPVDGKNCKGFQINGLALGIFYTQFALDEARKGGYAGPGAVLPLGVDLARYQPQDRLAMRDRMGLIKKNIPGDAFIVGNVNRNQPRKRLDLSIAYFAEWIKSRKITDAYLYLHLAPTGDRGWDVKQLAQYYGVSNRLIVTSTKLRPGIGVSEEYLSGMYSAFDLQISTTQGEGFGLTTIEGMACGIPQLVPDWSALGEWPGDSVVKVPCTSIATTPNDINIIGGIPDRVQFVEQLDALYQDRDRLADYGRRGLAKAQEPQFRWEHIGNRFAELMDQLHNGELDAPGEQWKPQEAAPALS